MFIFDAIKEEDLNIFSLPIKKLFDELKVLLGAINADILSKDESKVIIKKFWKEWSLSVYIIAKDKAIPAIGIEMTDKNCCVWMDDSHNIECERAPDLSTDFIQDIISAVRKCLSGVTVIAEYDDKDKLLKKTAYYGINTEGIREKRIGITTFGFPFFRMKPKHIKKITVSFI